MKFHNPDGTLLSPNDTKANDKPSAITLDKLAVVKAAGFAPEDLDDEFWALTLPELRYQLANTVAEFLGYEPEEVAILNPVKSETMGSAQFNTLLRRVNAGVKILPSALKAAVKAGTLSYHNTLGNTFRLAFGKLDRVTNNSTIKKALKAGHQILFPNERMLAKALKTWSKGNDNKPETLLNNAWTPERVILAAAIETRFTAEKLAALLPKATVEGAIVKATFGYAEVHFNFETGSIDNHVILNRVVSLGTKLDKATALGMFALSLHGVSTQASAKAKLYVAASSIFEEPVTGYGYWVEGSRHDVVRKNKIGILNIVAQGGGCTHFRLNDSRTYEDVVKAAFLYWLEGEPVAFEQQIGWAVAGDGARALGIGRKADFASIFSDASKPAKVPARPKLGGKITAETVDNTGNTTTVASGLGMLLSNGEVARAYGTRVEVALTNFVVGPGSGVALAAPGFSRRVRIKKAVSATIPAIYITVDPDSKLTKADLLKQAVEDKLWVNDAETIHYGEDVIRVDEIPYAIWDGMGLVCRVVGTPDITVSSKSDSVSVTVQVAAEFDFAAHKFNADGAKLTALEYPVTLIDVLEGKMVAQPELLLTTQEIKGTGPAAVRMWADNVSFNLDESLASGWITPEDHARGCVAYNTDEGLNEHQQVCFGEWRDAHSVVWEGHIEVDDETEALLKAMCDKASQDPAYAAEMGIDPGAFTFYGNGDLSQRFEAVVAEMTLGVELSTVLENVTKQALIGEQMVILKSIDSELGDLLWDGAESTRQAVLGMLDMAQGRVAPDTLEVDGPVFSFDKTKLRGRKLLENLRKKYPNGLTLTNPVNGNTMVTLRFDALCELGALLPGGSATGIALNTLELLYHLHVDRAGGAGWGSHLTRLVSIVKEAALSWAEKAKGSLGQVTKSRKIALGMKVKTTFSRELKSGQIGFNPNDPNVLSGKVVPGLYGLVERPPMTSPFGGDVVLTEECPIGMILVKAHLWSYGNEGDGDGDPAIVILVADPEMIGRIKLALKTSLFGPEGYLVAHGNDPTRLPYAEFYAENAKKTVHGVTHQVTHIPGEQYFADMHEVGRHYSRFLGRTFAMTSYLTYLLGTQLETSQVDRALEVACVLAWRRIYEGLGLSGLSSKAQVMAKHLATIGSDNRIAISEATAVELEARGYEVMSTPTYDGGIAFFVLGVDAVRYMWTVTVDERTELSPAVAEYLYQAVLVTHTYSLLEREVSTGDEYESGTSPEEVLLAAGDHLASEEILKDAIVYGMLRRGSKGLAIGVSMGEETGNGLFRYMDMDWLDELGTGIVGSMARVVYQVQTEMAGIRQMISEADL